MDLGPSSQQLETGYRGFGLARDGPLDMRMDASDEKAPTAARLINGLRQEDLVHIIRYR